MLAEVGERVTKERRIGDAQRFGPARLRRPLNSKDKVVVVIVGSDGALGTQFSVRGEIDANGVIRSASLQQTRHRQRNQSSWPSGWDIVIAGPPPQRTLRVVREVQADAPTKDSQRSKPSTTTGRPGDSGDPSAVRI